MVRCIFWMAKPGSYSRHKTQGGGVGGALSLTQHILTTAPPRSLCFTVGLTEAEQRAWPKVT